MKFSLFTIHAPNAARYLRFVTCATGKACSCSPKHGHKEQIPRALLALIFGATVYRSSRELKGTTARAVMHSYEADMARVSLQRLGQFIKQRVPDGVAKAAAS